jgi:subtilisin family serine protease
MSHRLLVKLRSGRALPLAGRGRVEPLYAGRGVGLEATAGPQWVVADVSETTTAWDTAHGQVASELGVAENDVLFVEPDLVHAIYRDPSESPSGTALGAAAACLSTPQDGTHGKATGPAAFAWHLDSNHSQLARARGAVAFATPRTRIAHIDTGYSRQHETAPANILRDRERSFADGIPERSSAEDPDRHAFLLDNSGHGTGTIGILAGGPSTPNGRSVLGGAPDADVLPIRVADRVVLLQTSALARGFQYAVEQQCDVITLSMGGLPSQAWSEAVDALYEAGVCLCAAAGNHIGTLPPRTLIYPARYPRAIAVCGVMADGRPYADLEGSALEGSHGPGSMMAAALTAYTPNIPWPVFGCTDVVRLNGEGTSAATPQVAAAVALWFERHKAALPRDWRRVEAVRHALFTTAKSSNRRGLFGVGVLQAFDALGVQPKLDRAKSPESRNSFAFLRLITGLGVVTPSPRERMFELELAQRWLVSDPLQALVPDPEATATVRPTDLRRLIEAIVSDTSLSAALRRHVAARTPALLQARPPRVPRRKVEVDTAVACSEEPRVRPPAVRRLRVYAADPMLAIQLATASVSELTLEVRWEPLAPGPVGEYLAVEDVDAAGHSYRPVDLDEKHLLAQDGWSASEANPQFHQQMIYAVAMKTIEHFERAMGRPVLWRPRPDARGRDTFVRQLLVRPHELRQANAFYSPARVALLFGYFDADASISGAVVPGSRIYTCVSHDIIAHETTHAILDGVQRRLQEATNPDVLAFHEAFADIVALLQHFTLSGLLRQQIRDTRGDVEAESLLGSLAVQFGQGSGAGAALRSAIGRFENGEWKRLMPDPAELGRRTAPHERGAILVAAVFDAFIACYRARTADLLRLATDGTGILRPGAIHPDLVTRLSDEASLVAGQILAICIRAIDYLPPVDITFFEYLRALITADFDVVTTDRLNYRVAIVEAFRRWGIYPFNIQTPSDDTPRTLAPDTLRWRGIDLTDLPPRTRGAVKREYLALAEGLRSFAGEALYVQAREELFEAEGRERRRLQRQLRVAVRSVPAFARQLGLDPARAVTVEQVHHAMRFGSDGRPLPQIIATVTQSLPLPGVPGRVFRGGSTVIIDLLELAVKYRVTKDVNSENRQARVRGFVAGGDPLHALLVAPDQPEPFALLHSLL